MISDDSSSSDSETGRFKCKTKTHVDQNSKLRQDDSRSSFRSRNSENNRGRRDFDRKREDRGRSRLTRHSPISKRRQSRDRSPYRRSHERHRHSRNRDSKDRSYLDRRRDSRDRQKHRHDRASESKRELKAEAKQILNVEESTSKIRKSKEKSPSPINKIKQSVVQIVAPLSKRKSDSPVVVNEQGDSEHSDVVQTGSYYKLIPTVVKNKSEDSSEIDSSDDEKLRAKLLNLEKQILKTKKKKHRKKHRRKSRKSSKEKDDVTTVVEVTSTTDIGDKAKVDLLNARADIVVEVTSTEKITQKESSDEGEILSDDDSQDTFEIDPNDLRHKLRNSTKKHKANVKYNDDVCGPALPPHLQKRNKSDSSSYEGPALPPHLEVHRNIGPIIPDDLRRTLAEKDCEIIEDDSPEEGDGFGPVPEGSGSKLSEVHQRLEERALEMKIKQLDGQGLDSSRVKSREQWMLELPDGKAKYLGLEARSFRAKQGPDMSDRSSWTDTPEDKARKAAGIAKEEDVAETLKREAKARYIARRDEEQEAAVKKHKKKHKRSESLLEIHQKKIKKKSKKDDKEEDKSERRPFSRDVDLQVNRFDEAQKKSIIKKAQGLNSRFSSGEAKYL